MLMLLLTTLWPFIVKKNMTNFVDFTKRKRFENFKSRVKVIDTTTILDFVVKIY